MLRSSIIALLGALALTGSVAAAPKTTAPGSTVGELVALARQLRPELAAAALNAEAAVARITSAGAKARPVGARRQGLRSSGLAYLARAAQTYKPHPTWKGP